MGRPLKYKTAAEMQKEIDRYFEKCKGEPMMIDGEPVFDKHGMPVIINVRPPTVSGLAYALGFTSRMALIKYQGREEFVDTVTRAKLVIERYAEERLFDRDGQRGAEFSLKYNFGWESKADEDSGGSGVVMMPPVKGGG